MKKVSRLFRVSLMLAVFFGLDKLLGVLRTVIIGRQFGMSPELDVFNAANNLPDVLFALISGGALAIAFIPVLSDILTKEGKKSAWKLFSSVANSAFILTGALAIIIALLAGPLVSGELGVAPGFSPDQQASVVKLMRMNLIATLIFSISGLMMAGLQANEHFLLPALAPLLYDVGQIFGAIILAPSEGYVIAGFQLPAFGMGIEGLVLGVILGAGLHLLIQIPGLIKYKFKWFPKIDYKNPAFLKVLRVMGPRLVSMFFIQLIYIARDNLASRLAENSVTALSFGWWIQQVPETLIGTAIATALLPTISELIIKEKHQAYKDTLERAVQVMIALSLPIAVILSLGSLPLIQTAFGVSIEDAGLIFRATQGYLVGLLGHCLVELGVRAFYARQKALVPMLVTGIGFVIYLGLGILLMGPLESAGIALANSISYSIQASILILLISMSAGRFKLGNTFIRTGISLVLGGALTWLLINVLPISNSALVSSLFAMVAGGVVASIPIWKEIRTLVQL
jgi:putative peptidoglycan lipid II flippase